ncbi:MAG TPA: hypothetical protein VGJ20_23195 [Xanthobacteraceae bacterium]|jgi:hypothetical protein
MSALGTEENTIDKLKYERQLALIWMNKVNKAAAERTPRGMFTPLESREIAEYYLNRYFEMVEAQLLR